MVLNDLYWAAGFLEGEGSFASSRTCPYVEASQVELEPLEKLLELFGGNIYYIDRATQKHNSPNWNNYYRWSIYGKKAVGVMLTLYSLMHSKRQGQIYKAVSGYNARPQRGDHYRVMTHCTHGHEYTEENTYMKSTGRQCKTCMTKYRKDYENRQIK